MSGVIWVVLNDDEALQEEKTVEGLVYEQCN